MRQLVVGFQGVAAALTHMHSKRIVDQDMFPGNVLRTLDGSRWVKIDLGNAAEMDKDGRPNRIDWCM